MVCVQASYALAWPILGSGIILLAQPAPNPQARSQIWSTLLGHCASVLCGQCVTVRRLAFAPADSC